MKNRKQRLAFILSLCMLVTVLSPFAALAVSAESTEGEETYVAQIVNAAGEVQSSLTQLGGNLTLNAGETLKILADTEYTSEIMIYTNPDQEGTCYIDGGGHTITMAGGTGLYAMGIVGAYAGQLSGLEANKTYHICPIQMDNLTIVSNGGGLKHYLMTDLTLGENMSMTAKGNVLFLNARDGDSTHYAKITIEGGTYIQQANCDGITVGAYDRLTINGGTVSLTGTATGTGTVRMTGAAQVTVNGGVISSANGLGYFFANNATATVNIYGGVSHFGNRVFHGADDGNINATVNVYGGVLATDGAVFARMNKITVNIYGADIYMKSVRTDVTDTEPKQGDIYVSAGNAKVNVISRCKLEVLQSPSLVRNMNGGTWPAKSDTIGTEVGSLYVRKTSDYDMVSMKAGAAVRMVNDENGNGLRFTATVSASAIAYANALKDDGTSLSYGTVITLKENITDYFTMAALDAQGKQYQDVAAVNGLTENEDGSITVRSAITKIKTENLGKEFAAVAYVKYIKNGQTVYLYASDCVERSMAYVAQAALNDVADAQGNGYTVLLTEGANAGKYSPYTAEQRAVLQSYIPAGN